MKLLLYNYKLCWLKLETTFLWRLSGLCHCKPLTVLPVSLHGSDYQSLQTCTNIYLIKRISVFASSACQLLLNFILHEVSSLFSFFHRLYWNTSQEEWMCFVHKLFNTQLDIFNCEFVCSREMVFTSVTGHCSKRRV